MFRFVDLQANGIMGNWTPERHQSQNNTHSKKSLNIELIHNLGYEWTNLLSVFLGGGGQPGRCLRVQDVEHLKYTKK